MNPSDAPNRPAAILTRLVALWILTGAFFKLLVGTPNDLPQLVRDLPLEVGLTYKLAISIELALGFCTLVKPRWTWHLLAGALITFNAILVAQIAAGDANCGCFGSQVSMPPWLMLAIDSVLLVGLLVTRPWSGLAGGPRAPLPAALIAIGIAVPWFFDREIKPGATVDGQDVAGAFMMLDLDEWVGQSVLDIPLAQPPLNQYIDVESLFLDGLWVFWRATCDHCAEHLSHLADTEMGERFISLIQIREKHDTEGNRVVHRMPQGGFVAQATLPETITYGLTTPAELLLEAAMITAAKEGVSPDESLTSSN